jgi:hypothetical protein
MLLCFCPNSTLNLFPLKSGDNRFGLPRDGIGPSWDRYRAILEIEILSKIHRDVALEMNWADSPSGSSVLRSGVPLEWSKWQLLPSFVADGFRQGSGGCEPMSSVRWGQLRRCALTADFAAKFEGVHAAVIMRLQRFFLHVSPAKTYYAAYFGKRFLMGNQQAIECACAQSAVMQMYLSRIR